MTASLPAVRVQLLSDLHMEEYGDGGDALIRQLDPQDVDVLVVAGDLAEWPLLDNALARLCDRYPAVVYVTGNHEYFGASPAPVHELLQGIAARRSNLHWLHHDAKEIAGLRFVGTTLWYPDSPEVASARSLMPDFVQIEDFEPWVYEENDRAVALLRREAWRADVVVTHHLPSARSIAPEHATSPLNACFVCDVEDAFGGNGPALWMHGHTHGSCDYQLGATRVLCNPRGAQSELNPDFLEKLVVGIAPR